MSVLLDHGLKVSQSLGYFTFSEFNQQNNGGLPLCSIYDLYNPIELFHTIMTIIVFLLFWLLLE